MALGHRVDFGSLQWGGQSCARSQTFSEPRSREIELWRSCSASARATFHWWNVGT